MNATWDGNKSSQKCIKVKCAVINSSFRMYNLFYLWQRFCLYEMCCILYQQPVSREI